MGRLAPMTTRPHRREAMGRRSVGPPSIAAAVRAEEPDGGAIDRERVTRSDSRSAFVMNDGVDQRAECRVDLGLGP